MLICDFEAFIKMILVTFQFSGNMQKHYDIVGLTEMEGDSLLRYMLSRKVSLFLAI